MVPVRRCELCFIVCVATFSIDVGFQLFANEAFYCHRY